MDTTTTVFPSASTAETPENLTGGVVHFHIADYLVMVFMLILSLAIGAYFAFYGGKQKTTREYFKGDRNMSTFPIVLSLMASFLSSNGMLGVPAEVYSNGFNFWFSLTGSLLAVPFAAYNFLPVFYELQITSVYEYLQRRFNRTIRLCGSILSVATIMIHSSFVTYGPSLALSQVTGLHLWGSIFTTISIASIYTSLGGIKAVLWTDAIQLLIYIIALFVSVIKGALDVGGISYILSKAEEGGRLQALSFSVDPKVRFTFWGCFIYGLLKFSNTFGVSQIQIQRYLCCPTKKAARKSLWLNYPGLFFIITMYCFLGLILYVHYWNCDPIRSRQIEQADQIFPLFIMHVMKNLHGLPGLFVAGVYSASLSTTSSQLNSLAAITLEDYIRPCWKNLSDEKATKISKFIALGYGGVCLLMIAGISNLGSILQSIQYLVGGCLGANFGLFTLGLLLPWSNTKGSIVGMCSGLILSWWISLGNQINKPKLSSLPVSIEGCNSTIGEWTPFYPPERSDDVLDIYKMSYMWVMPLAWFTTFVIGAIASLFIGSKGDVDPRLYSPFTRYVMRKFGYLEKQISPQEAVEEKIKLEPPPYDESVQIPMLSNKEEKTEEK